MSLLERVPRFTMAQLRNCRRLPQGTYSEPGDSKFLRRLATGSTGRGRLTSTPAVRAWTETWHVFERIPARFSGTTPHSGDVEVSISVDVILGIICSKQKVRRFHSRNVAVECGIRDVVGSRSTLCGSIE